MLERGRKPCEKCLIHRLAVEIPDSCLCAHFQFRLAALPDSVNRLNIGSLIHRLPVYFHPCVRLEGQFLRSQDHLCTDTVLSEEVGNDEGALQAEGLLWVPHTGIIDCGADPLDGVLAHALLGNFPAYYRPMKRLEAAEHIQNIVEQQCCHSLEKEH